jgi:uncharacterized protein YceH (UPF0502 family)
VDLTAEELRVLGSLVEKHRTTPDQYPLSLNALRLACNQSTNRDPVVDYDEHTIREALERLSRRRWVRLASGAGSRAVKYRHLLDEALGVSGPEIAVLAVLMLRGAQTPGELRSRTERMHHFAGQQDVGETLERLIGRELVVRLGRRPGQKEERYAHLLGAEQDAAPATAVAGSPLEERVERLEAAVAELREAIEALPGGVHDQSAAVKHTA